MKLTFAFGLAILVMVHGGLNPAAILIGFACYWLLSIFLPE